MRSVIARFTTSLSAPGTMAQVEVVRSEPSPCVRLHKGPTIGG